MLIGHLPNLLALDPDSGKIIGCLYLYPPERQGYDVDGRSWVTTERASLDKPPPDAVLAWLGGAWPFRSPDYAPR